MNQEFNPSPPAANQEGPSDRALRLASLKRNIQLFSTMPKSEFAQNVPSIFTTQDQDLKMSVLYAVQRRIDGRGISQHIDEKAIRQMVEKREMWQHPDKEGERFISFHDPRDSAVFTVLDALDTKKRQRVVTMPSGAKEDYHETELLVEKINKYLGKDQQMKVVGAEEDIDLSTVFGLNLHSVPDLLKKREAPLPKEFKGEAKALSSLLQLIQRKTSLSYDSDKGVNIQLSMGKGKDINQSRLLSDIFLLSTDESGVLGKVFGSLRNPDSQELITFFAFLQRFTDQGLTEWLVQASRGNIRRMKETGIALLNEACKNPEYAEAIKNDLMIEVPGLEGLKDKIFGKLLTMGIHQSIEPALLEGMFKLSGANFLSQLVENMKPSFHGLPVNVDDLNVVLDGKAAKLLTGMLNNSVDLNELLKLSDRQLRTLITLAGAETWSRRPGRYAISIDSEQKASITLPNVIESDEQPGIYYLDIVGSDWYIPIRPSRLDRQHPDRIGFNYGENGMEFGFLKIRKE